MIDLKNLTIEKASAHLGHGDFSAVDLTQAYLEEIKKKNEELNVFREVFSDALEQAKNADQMIKEGKATALTGIPIAIKDNILFSGHKAGASSKILENYTAPYSSTVVKLLKEAGAVLIGRTNMDEFAMGSSTENSAYGVTKNPLDPTRVPGGSSGGSAAAVAADMALLALGSDTGGSIRQPASFCGAVGMMPTYGTVSRYGLMAMGSSLDVIGPIAKTVRDAEIVWETIGKYDPMDSTSYPDEIRIKYSSKNPKKKIGIPTSFLKDLTPEIRADFDASIEKMKKAGYETVEVDLPLMKYSLPIYYILQPAEVSSNLARFDGVRYGLREEGENLLDVYKKTRGKGFGKEVRRRIMLGTYVLSHGYYDAYYNKANRLRNQIRADFKKVFETVDVIATPTSPFPAFKIGEKANDPLAMYLSDMFTVPANIAGIPAISIPSGKTQEGLPLGFHLIAPQFGEDILFAIGKEFETM